MEDQEIYVDVYEALARAIKEKKRIYNMKPNKTASFTIYNFFHKEIKIVKTNNTEYVCIKCLFHECDGQRINDQLFNLQVSLLNGYPPLYALLDKHRDMSSVTVKLIRTDKVIYYYDIINTNTNTNTYTDRDTYTDTNIDTYIDSELGISKGMSKGR